jgi:putative oxidoreductase
MTTNNTATPTPTAPDALPHRLAARWRVAMPKLLSVLRIIAGFLFLQYGTTKLFAFPAALMPGGGTAELLTLTGIAGILETFGGLLLLAGLFTRPVAFILSGQMAVAYFMFHAPQGFWPVVNHGDSAVFYCFLWLYLSAAGPGPWSLDALLQKRREGVAACPPPRPASKTALAA